jgi:glutathione S-transferase
MKLYYVPGGCPLATHIVLEWIGAPYEAVRMTPASIKSPEYLALNPNGTVPLLMDGDFALSQNVAILSYVADRHPEARLLGDGTQRGRAEVMKWLGFLNSDLHPAFKPIFAPSRFLADPAFASEIADTARAQVRVLLGRVDQRLERNDWLAGERSVADPYLFVMLRWATRLNVAIDGLANLARFAGRMHNDVAVRNAVRMEERAVDLAA